jgi:hypothetical protein
MKRALSSALAAFTVLFLAAPAARADASSAAAAEALYNEGKKAEAKGDFNTACPKFAESQKLDPAAGTLLHLANCYEKTQRLASAWATYLEAAAAAHSQGRADWEKAARTKAAAIEPKVSKLIINVDAPAAGQVIKRDDVEVAAASVGVPIPVDSGAHTITAEAPKKKPFTTTVDVPGGAAKVEAKVPKLEDAPEATPPPATPQPTKEPSPPPPPPHEESGSSRKTIGYIVGGVGVVGLGVGAVTGLMAISANNDSKKACPQSGACADKSGVDANDRAKTLGTVSTIGFIAGGVLLAAGAGLVLTAPSSTEKRAARALVPSHSTLEVSVAPDVGAKNAGLVVVGAF